MNTPDYLNNGDKNTYRKNVRKKILFILNIIIRTVQSLFILFIIFILLGASTGVGMGFGYLAFLVSSTQPPSKEELKTEIGDLSEVSKMVYSDGSMIAIIQSDLIRTRVTSEQISPLLKKAIISTEDENFENHHGVVPKALVRAVISDATGIGGSSGGSTLTQQLVKQQLLTDETTFKRKANEVVLAYRIENFFSKEEILTAYLNVSPFGRNNKGENIAGAQEAAQGIFGKNASDLTLPQAAFIAGLPQSPIVYSPYTSTGGIKDAENLSFGLDRKNFVLFSMYREKAITKEEYEAAKAYDLTQDFLPKEAANKNTQSYLYDAVLHQAIQTLADASMKNDGLTKQLLETNTINQYEQQAKNDIQTKGYTIHSTIDANVYTAMQTAVATYGYILDGDAVGHGLVETGNVLMDNATGQIIGFVGGRDFEENQVNHAFDSYRQIGSSVKPIAIYGPAIDQGLIGSESRLANYPVFYKSDEQKQIQNATNSGTNTFDTVRHSLDASYNIPVYHLNEAMKEKMGDDNFSYNNYLSKMNYPNNKNWSVESAPLGTVETTVLTQTNGFQTLANKGIYEEGYMIEKIVDSNYNVIYEHETEPVQVYSEATASIMNDLMRSALDSAIVTPFNSMITNLNPNLAAIDWVGKTGTTEEYVDAWLIVSTPAITLSSWTGYNDAVSMGSASGNRNSAYLAYLINEVYAIRPDLFGEGQTFTLADTVIPSTVSSFTGEKEGFFSHNGQLYTTPPGTTTSLYAKNGAPKSEYKFGYGGTDENYSNYWKGHLTKVETTPSSSSSSSNKKESGSSDSKENNKRDSSDSANKEITDSQMSPNNNN